MDASLSGKEVKMLYSSLVEEVISGKIRWKNILIKISSKFLRIRL